MVAQLILIDQGDWAAHEIDAWTLVLFMPKKSPCELRTWHSDQIQQDAPDLPAKIRELVFQELADARVVKNKEAMAIVKAEQEKRRRGEEKIRVMQQQLEDTVTANAKLVADIEQLKSQTRPA